ncbi:unnamed protein product [Schistocephalus solidus]|uniref:Uncharacterized protein n=1 Tax=Schistocephalus solidus TaxID=70667 RepID=A0A183SRZ7_SCHSO|nr:unnamed protein product [Schistocephalus solidus]
MLGKFATTRKSPFCAHTMLPGTGRALPFAVVELLIVIIWEMNRAILANIPTVNPSLNPPTTTNLTTGDHFACVPPSSVSGTVLPATTAASITAVTSIDTTSLTPTTAATTCQQPPFPLAVMTRF